MGQFPFLMEIVDNDGISQEKLSSQLKISKSTTAVIVRQLLESGLITRKPDEKDRRNFHLHATEKARNLIPGIEKIIDLCHSTILQDLTDDEQNQFVDLLRKVRNRTEISFTKRKKS